MPKSYQKINLTSDIVLSWPEFFTSGVMAFDYNSVYATVNGFSITLPNASLNVIGTDMIFSNKSSVTFKILNNSGTLLKTVNAGEVIEFILTDSSNAAGEWDIFPYGSGVSDIISLTATSSDASIIIANPTITPPGGAIDFSLPSSISSIMSVVAKGIAVITSGSPTLQWTSRDIVPGSQNVTVTNGSGVDGNIGINLASNLVGVNSADIGGISFQNKEITTTTDEDLSMTAKGTGSVNISTTGTGTVNLNTVSIDKSANVSGINSLSVQSLDVTSSFVSPNNASAWCMFTYSSLGGINKESSVNIKSITKDGDGKYIITFDTAMPNINYAVFISLGIATTSPITTYAYFTTRTLTTVTICVVDSAKQSVTDLGSGVSVMVMSKA